MSSLVIFSSASVSNHRKRVIFCMLVFLVVMGLDPRTVRRPSGRQ